MVHPSPSSGRQTVEIDMSDQITASEGAPNASKDESLNEAQMIALLTGEGQEDTQEEIAEEQPEESQDESTETEAEATDETEADEEEESEESDETEGLDLDQLTEEQWEAVRAKLKSGAAARIKALTAQLKAKDETLAALKAQAPTELAPKRIENNPYGDVKELGALQEKEEEIARVIESTDAILDEHEDYALDDIITVGGKEYTKRQLKEANRNARKAQKDFIPAQRAEIQRGEARKELRASFDAKAQEEVKEIADESTDVSKNFKALTSDPLFQQIRDKVPDAEPVLNYILAHFCKSRFGKQTKIPQQVTPASKPKAKPPEQPGGVASVGQSKVGNTKQKQAENKARRFEETGSRDDLANFLAETLT